MAAMELHRGDGSLGTFLGVQSGLAMKSIALLGSEEQKERWLPAMARLDAIGAFALTEPAHGSDSVALETSARRDRDGWVLDGAKRWIGNGSIADVVVWARSRGTERDIAACVPHRTSRSENDRQPGETARDGAAQREPSDAVGVVDVVVHAPPLHVRGIEDGHSVLTSPPSMT